MARLKIAEPTRSQLAHRPGVTLSVIAKAERRWRARRERGPAGTGLLIVLIKDEADAEVARRRAGPRPGSVADIRRVREQTEPATSAEIRDAAAKHGFPESSA